MDLVIGSALSHQFSVNGEWFQRSLAVLGTRHAVRKTG